MSQFRRQILRGTRFGAWRTGAGLWLVVTYLLASTPLAGLATAAFAWLDGEHRVEMRAESQGFSVVLRHDARSVRTAHGHDHCVAIRTLLLLSDATGPADSDHVLTFGAGLSGVTRPEATSVRPGRATPSDPGVAPAGRTGGFLAASGVAWQPQFSLPPPGLARTGDHRPGPTSVDVTRATVLLI